MRPTDLAFALHTARHVGVPERGSLMLLGTAFTGPLAHSGARWVLKFPVAGVGASLWRLCLLVTTLTETAVSGQLRIRPMLHAVRSSGPLEETR